MKRPIVPWMAIATAVVLTMAFAILRSVHVENAAELVLVSGLAASGAVGVLIIALTKR